jgi:hypothetical protein
MSVRSETYIIIGVRLNLITGLNATDQELDNIQFPWCGRGAQGTMGVLIDGMGDTNHFAGYCVSVTDECDGFPEPMSFDLINAASRLPPNTLELTEEWLDTNGLRRFTDQPVRLHVITYYH